MNTILKTILCLLWASLIFFGCEQAPQDADTFLEAHITENHIAGISTARSDANGNLTFVSKGVADTEKETLFTENTLLNIGSVSKTFTATAVMQLREKGLIDLDADVSDYLPELTVRNPNHPEDSITVRQLLTHTSSINDSEAYDASYACGDPAVSLKDWIYGYFTEDSAFYTSDNFHSYAPGEEWNYSNVGFGVLGCVVESITGIPFYQYCQENIFGPLDMTYTGWMLTNIDVSTHASPSVYITEEIKDMARERIGKFFLEDQEFLAGNYYGLCLYSFYNYPDGLLRSSTNDLSHFLTAMLNGGTYKDTQILKASTIEEMMTNQTDKNEKQGFCWQYTGFDGVWGHGGDDPGIKAGLYMQKEKKVGMILLQNSNEGSRTDVLKFLYQSAQQ
ncbi:MAG: serine hydrolase domain-containing protein [Bacteroidota bacterium]